MKKFLASIIAVVLAVSGLSVISITANAATIFISGNYEYTVNSDDTVNIAGYKGIATDITIPSQILNKNVVKISDNSFYNNSTLTSVKIPNTIKVVGSMAFHNCTKLSKVTLPSNLTEIGYNAFEGTTALTTITIPKTVTTAGNNVFNGSALKTATIENGATAVADNLFSNAKNL
ncbi:leucine-rich repeat domain-containing protein, partial [Ruminococcus sp.]